MWTFNEVMAVFQLVGTFIAFSLVVMLIADWLWDDYSND